MKILNKLVKNNFGSKITFASLIVLSSHIFSSQEIIKKWRMSPTGPIISYYTESLYCGKNTKTDEILCTEMTRMGKTEYEAIIGTFQSKILFNKLQHVYLEQKKAKSSKSKETKA